MTTKKRNPIISGFFSFLQPGLGQLYNGEVIKSIFFFLAPTAITFVLYLSPTLKINGGIYIIFSILISFRIYAAFEAAKKSGRKKDYMIKKVNNPLIYIMILLGWGYLSGLLSNEIRQVSRYHSFKIPTPNMENTLLIGDFIISDIQYFKYNDIAIGDIALFHPPVESSNLWIQRVAGTEGDTVEMRSGNFYLNGELTNFTNTINRISNRTLEPTYQEPQIFNSIGNSHHFGPYLVPKDKVFLLGDNRDNSFDSRFFGFVKKENILGKPLYVWYSHEKGMPRQERILKEIK